MLGEADAKFPDQTSGGIPPSPTRENPGQVYPKSDPQAAPKSTVPGTGIQSGTPTSVIGNPYLLENALRRLDTSLDDLIRIIESEESATGSSSKETMYLEKFKSWKEELAAVSTDGGGGLFVD
ncbi:hypothetical protein HYDPIDRAFT_28708 [Hydnomerulius pinastri MD-312]|uniref:Uncharacterized protein n=1 Tax=Hydnomerulius pinastri MD-312 TaxID=994086 RepID=A0A0C9WFK9_9AGAM|nr:hypothetical protein HYDPIDRAFT_28708 [Hydnomerulius pinastri MD-312]